MSIKNSKGQLKEWLEKRKYPNFITKKSLNEYIVSVTIGKSCYQYSARTEQECCEKILNDILQIRYHPCQGQNYLLLDLENYGCILTQLPLLREKYSNYNIIGFCNLHHPFAVQENIKNMLREFMDVEIVPCSERDACDFYIAIYITKYLENRNVTLVTKDHFGSVLSHLNSNINWISSL